VIELVKESIAVLVIITYMLSISVNFVTAREFFIPNACIYSLQVYYYYYPRYILYAGYLHLYS